MRKSVNIFLPFFLILFAIYSPITKGYFAYIDDYQYIIPANHFDYKHWFAHGIPIYHLINWIEVYLINSMEAANIGRLVNIFILTLASCSIFIWIKKHSINKYEAGLVTVAIVAAPSFSLNISWLVQLPGILAILITVISVNIASKANQIQNSKWKRFYLRKAGYINRYHFISGSLLLFALCIYQPSALLYWALLAIPITRVEFQNWKEEKKAILSYFGIGIVTYITYMFFLQTVIRIISGVSGRGLPSLNFLDKFIWFLKTPTINSLNFLSFHTSVTVSFVVLTIVLLGFLIEVIQIINRHGINRIHLLFYFQKSTITLFLIPLCAVTYFLKENNSHYHLLIAYPSIVIILFYTGLIRIKQIVPTQWKSMVNSLGILIVLTSSYFANDTVSKYIMQPQSLESRYIKYYIQQNLTPEIDSIKIIRPPYLTGFEPLYKEDIGVYSSSVQSMSILMVKAILNEIGLNQSKFEITSVLFCNKLNDNLQNLRCSSDTDTTIIIDMTKLKYFR